MSQYEGLVRKIRTLQTKSCVHNYIASESDSWCDSCLSCVGWNIVRDVALKHSADILERFCRECSNYITGRSVIYPCDTTLQIERGIAHGKKVGHV